MHVYDIRQKKFIDENFEFDNLGRIISIKIKIHLIKKYKVKITFPMVSNDLIDNIILKGGNYAIYVHLTQDQALHHYQYHCTPIQTLLVAIHGFLWTTHHYISVLAPLFYVFVHPMHPISYSLGQKK